MPVQNRVCSVNMHRDQEISDAICSRRWLQCASGREMDYLKLTNSR